jgi:hypothetical protein
MRRWFFESSGDLDVTSKTLITPALFSHRTPPDREKRENSKTASTGFPLSRCGGLGGGGRGGRG